MATKNSIEYPFEYKVLGTEETQEVKNYFSPLFSKLIRLGSKGYFFFQEFEDTILNIHNMEIRLNDTFVITFPRSGTTWTQELVWLLQNDCDFERSRAIPLTTRFPFMEFGALMNMKLPDVMLQNAYLEKFVAENSLSDLSALSAMPSPRFLKCHLPLSLMPSSLLDIAKVVYVARNPRDVAVSNFFHLKSWTIIPEHREFKPFWNFFIQNKALWCPYFEHVKEAWSQRNHPNMIFIFYEDLCKNLPAEARRLATFFGREYSEKQFQELCDHLVFDNFKNNTSVNLKDLRDSGLLTGNFVRKGKAGGWREHFDAEMTQQAESWIADNLRDTDLRFPEC